VLEFNDAAAQFPTLVIARLFGFQPQSMLASTTNEAERETLRIQM
jgi:LemA protein